MASPELARLPVIAVAVSAVSCLAASVCLGLLAGSAGAPVTHAPQGSYEFSRTANALTLGALSGVAGLLGLVLVAAAIVVVLARRSCPGRHRA